MSVPADLVEPCSAETFDPLVRDFARRTHLHVVHWPLGRPTLTAFGHPPPDPAAVRRMLLAGPAGDPVVPQLARWSALGRRGRLAVVISTSQLDPAELGEQLAPLRERFAVTVAGPEHPIARAHPCAPAAFAVARFESCAATAIVDAFAAWAVTR